MTLEQFETFVQEWLRSEEDAVYHRAKADHAFNTALLAADGKSAEQRKAQAELAAETHEQTALICEARARARRMTVDFLVNTAKTAPESAPVREGIF